MDIEWIRRGLQKPGKSQAGLARALGVDASAVSKILIRRDGKGKTKPRAVKTSEVQRIADYLGEPVPESWNRGGNNLSGNVHKSDGFAAVPPSVMSPDVSNLPRDLPVYELVPNREAVGMFTISTEEVGMLHRPPGLLYAKKAFCINILTNSMGEALRQGYEYAVNPSQPARAGDDVVVEFTSGPDAGWCTVKRLVGWDGDHVLLKQFEPELEERFKNDMVILKRIVPWPEAMRG